MRIAMAGVFTQTKTKTNFAYKLGIEQKVNSHRLLNTLHILYTDPLFKFYITLICNLITKVSGIQFVLSWILLTQIFTDMKRKTLMLDVLNIDAFSVTDC